MIANTKIETPALAGIVDGRSTIEGITISIAGFINDVQASQPLLAGISIEP